MSPSSIYGGTYNLFAHTLGKLGIKVHFVDANDASNFEHAITDKTKAIFAETIGGVIVDSGKFDWKKAGQKLIDSVQLFSHLANVGDSKSLIIHPASTTHQQLTLEEQIASGVTPGLIRLSNGTEAIDDIIDDLKQAIELSQE